MKRNPMWTRRILSCVIFFKDNFHDFTRMWANLDAPLKVAELEVQAAGG